MANTVKTFLRYRSEERPLTSLSAPETKSSPLENSEIDQNFETLQTAVDSKSDSANPVFTGLANFSNASAIILPIVSDIDGVISYPSSPVEGMLIYNSHTHQVESYQNGSWQQIGGGATGGNDDKVFYLSDKYVTGSYKIPAGKNAMVAGELVIGAKGTVNYDSEGNVTGITETEITDKAITITVQPGSRLVIV